ncbi:hypothetical protein [Streptomyces sp. SYSU K21746]
MARHLKIAGQPDQLVTGDVLMLIPLTSRGCPRAVNDLALPSTSPCRPSSPVFATGKNLLDEAAARAFP